MWDFRSRFSRFLGCADGSQSAVAANSKLSRLLIKINSPHAVSPILPRGFNWERRGNAIDRETP
jgi:hypothetical protein